MAVLWLVLLLTPLPCTLLTGLEACPARFRMFPADPDSPITNVTVDPGRKAVCWEPTDHVSGIECFINGRIITKATGNCCRIPVLRRCEAKNYTVRGIAAGNRPVSAWVCYPEPEGSPGVAARGLTCRVHDIDYLTCTWEVGPEAPRDVQYRLSLQNVRTDRAWDCPRYVANDRGTRTGCEFGDLSRFVRDQHRVLVSGTSQRAHVPCAEIIRALRDIETLSPPNVTASCNASRARLAWTMYSHFQSAFEFELEIQKGSDPVYLQQAFRANAFILNNPGAHTVRVRALVTRQTVSGWSAPQHFACDPEEPVRPRAWHVPVVASLALLLTVGPALLLCKRYALMQKLFPSIPRLKDPIGDFNTEKVLAWESGADGLEDCPVAKVQVLGEK